jgi:CheY-like chemotaxis protein
MGGELSIARLDAGGSCVTTLLPYESAGLSLSATVESHESDRLTPGSQHAVPPLNILMADDSDDSFYVIEAYLQGQGHQLARAVDGSQAVELFKSGNYDLVLMDVHMPAMDGYAATLAIREWETTSGRARVPIVVLSSDSADTQRQHGAVVGCSGYLTKPTSKAALMASLKRFAPR